MKNTGFSQTCISCIKYKSVMKIHYDGGGRGEFNYVDLSYFQTKST